ncbi:hypothetical protein OGAPHI_006281 [Ogataea philodendri]|uniref:Uncharacterized protein n=1 Tax=Ogataea philodendri TaxID=1378263 RepID=A0A9P8NYI3_9ASCO|nr:uncharacterized protein OGAPHI_006281 [Ogataea philodendri]KAH3662100.1 hypothetical protein OGAPHI_006281 [Ogataea philodendri]
MYAIDGVYWYDSKSSGASGALVAMRSSISSNSWNEVAEEGTVDITLGDISSITARLKSCLNNWSGSTGTTGAESGVTICSGSFSGSELLIVDRSSLSSSECLTSSSSLARVGLAMRVLIMMESLLLCRSGCLASCLLMYSQHLSPYALGVWPVTLLNTLWKCHGLRFDLDANSLNPSTPPLRLFLRLGRATLPRLLSGGEGDLETASSPMETPQLAERAASAMWRHARSISFRWSNLLRVNGTSSESSTGPPESRFFSPLLLLFHRVSFRALFLSSSSSISGLMNPIDSFTCSTVLTRRSKLIDTKLSDNPSGWDSLSGRQCLQGRKPLATASLS